VKKLKYFDIYRKKAAVLSKYTFNWSYYLTAQDKLLS
jgi:hypothetical protein